MKIRITKLSEVAEINPRRISTALEASSLVSFVPMEVVEGAIQIDVCERASG